MKKHKSVFILIFRYVAIDSNAEKAIEARNKGLPVFYGMPPLNSIYYVSGSRSSKRLFISYQVTPIDLMF